MPSSSVCMDREYRLHIQCHCTGGDRYHRHARNLLADQEGSAPDSSVSVWDVHRLTRNLCVKHQALNRFNAHVAHINRMYSPFLYLLKP